MAEDFQPSNCWFDTTNNSDDHSDYTFSTPSTDWSQHLFSSGTEMAESSSFHAMLPEVYSTSSIYQPFMPNSSSPPSSSSSYACSSAPVELSGVSNETSEIFKGSPLTLTQQPSINQLQFSNNASFWNDASGFFPPSLPPIRPQLFETKPCFNPLFAKNSGKQREKSSCEPSLKKPRIASPSTLPAFKVKKEKLGDRVAALQQLVSPFGKKARKSNDTEESMQELRSRGLCLVPVASTYSIAGETFADILSVQNFGRAFM